MKRFTVFIFVLVLLFCTVGAAAALPMPRPGSFTVGFGETVTPFGYGTSITFADVVEDSRCPLQVNCFWEGAVEIELNVAFEGGLAGETVRLRLEGMNPDPSQVQLSNGLLLTLWRVDPYPVTPDPIPLKAYKATLELRAPR